MTSTINRRLAKLEQQANVRSDVFVWTDPDNPDAEPEYIDLCGLTHEECLDLLDKPEAVQ